jgi:hypothetical protein
LRSTASPARARSAGTALQRRRSAPGRRSAPLSLNADGRARGAPRRASLRPGARPAAAGHRPRRGTGARSTSGRATRGTRRRRGRSRPATSRHSGRNPACSPTRSRAEGRPAPHRWGAGGHGAAGGRAAQPVVLRAPGRVQQEVPGPIERDHHRGRLGARRDVGVIAAGELPVGGDDDLRIRLRVHLEELVRVGRRRHAGNAGRSAFSSSTRPRASPHAATGGRGRTSAASGPDGSSPPDAGVRRLPP